MSKYLFILGVGRSGTTFLGRAVALTSSRIKFISEIFPGVKTIQDRKHKDPNFAHPFDSDRIEDLCGAIRQSCQDNSLIMPSELKLRVQRDDTDKDHLVVKEVHALLAFPEVARKLNARTVIITRETLRVIDSYFRGPKPRIYMEEEYRFLRKYLRDQSEHPDDLLDTSIAACPPAVIEYIRRPFLLTRELVRQTCITEFLRIYLLQWVTRDTKTMHITHSELSMAPVETMRRVFDFLNLQYDGNTVNGIKAMTSGKETGYYETQKNSRQIAEQPYKYLTEKQQRYLTGLISAN